MTKRSLMQDENLKKLVKKYLNDECNEQEIQMLHEWYDSFDEDQDIIESLTSEQLKQLRLRLLSRIRKNIATDLEPVQLVSRHRSTRKIVYLVTGIAAMILLVMGIFISVSDHLKAPQRTVSTDLIVRNSTKSIQKVTLEDGSMVWLNPNSKIVYPRKFTAASRELHMDGEAFFEVKPDIKRPFIIYSNNIVTRVWGTSFLVRSFQGGAQEVSVVTGKVSVRLQQQNDTSSIMLTPDQKASFVKAENVLKKEEELKNSPVRIWQKTTLYFDNTTLKDVLTVLNKRFDVSISTRGESLLSYSLTADFTDQSLPAILEMLGKSLDLKYEINEDQITLYN